MERKMVVVAVGVCGGGGSGDDGVRGREVASMVGLVVGEVERGGGGDSGS